MRRHTRRRGQNKELKKKKTTKKTERLRKEGRRKAEAYVKIA